MLKIEVKGTESFDDEKQEFVYSESTLLEFEHSLVSLSKWESKFEKPFLGPDKKTSEETFGYLEAMCLTPDVPREVFLRLSEDDLNVINSYIEAKMTATTFSNIKSPAGPRPTITNELIYHWMITFNVPLECENWHLGRLFTLLTVLNEKNQPKKKMSRSDAAARQRELNEQRRAKFNSTG